MHNKKTISILGCGWFGTALATELIKKDYTVKGSTTTAVKLPLLASKEIDPYLINFATDINSKNSEFFDCVILFIAIPPKVRSGGGNEYLPNISKIIKAVKLHKIPQVIFISSTGVYGDVNREVNEDSSPEPDTPSGKILLKAELLLKQETTFTTTILRFAGLIGPGRDPGRFFAGKSDIPNGQAPVNLIHLTDCVTISCAIIEKELWVYTYNACAPSHPSKMDFYTSATIRSCLEKPRFIDELSSWKTVQNKNVPRILGYQYQVANLMEWLNS